MITSERQSPGRSLVANPGGRFFLAAFALLLLLGGLVAVGLGVSGRFLPHDEAFLGLTAGQLCGLNACRIVHFMLHNRISFGGALTAVGLLYLWLALSPLKGRQTWAWWAFLLTGLVGFATFLAYLGYGYLDTWHGLATLGLLPLFLLGLALSWSHRADLAGIRTLLRPAVCWPWTSVAGLGRVCLLATAFGLVFGGLVILVVSMTCVFVPQDLAYLGVGVEQLHALNPRLVPLIAHDRAGFGEAVCCCGLTLFLSVWCGKPSRGLWAVLALVGIAGFGTAIGVHPAIGYTDATHLAPAVFGALVYLLGLILTFRPMVVGGGGSPHAFREGEPSALGTDRASVLPSLHDLGLDLLHVPLPRRLFSLALPFLWCGAYFVLATRGWWLAAVLAVMALSFVTYGSISHDLVHRTLGLPRRANDLLLCLVELLALRSGHAYRAAHLHHHARYPGLDDIEATAARRSWMGALAEGVVFQFRIWLWAVRRAPQDRGWIIGEGLARLSLAVLAMALLPVTPVPLVYGGLVVMGSWVIPLVTSYLPHDPNGVNELFQTRVFRGVVASVIALEHLYHLEHHLYPAAPHHNWPKLAKRLDPYLVRAGVKPVRWWF
jgi:fatty acid desaturase